jgi:hypothetical protein
VGSVTALAESTTVTPEALVAAGLSVLPVKADGTKAPAGDWKRFQLQRADLEQVLGWVEAGYGLGVVCGAISGRLEMTEIEGRGGLLERLIELVREAGLDDLWERLLNGWVVISPSGGLHFYYRLADGAVPGNTKLAQTAEHVTLAETRGEGGLVVTPPSGGGVHPSGRPWTTWAGSPATIPTITLEERAEFHRLLRALDERPVAPASPFAPLGSGSTGGVSPGDDFTARTTWADVLEPAGWRQVGVRGSVTHWRRPGKNVGISATTGFGAGDWLYVFTSSTEFEPERTYTRFGAWSVLHHGGDHKAAAQALQVRGYGHRPERSTPLPAVATVEPVAVGDPSDTAPVTVPAFPWDSRPVLQHLHDFARARMVAPLAVLGVAVARVVAATPAGYVLPALIGGHGTLNVFVALVGPSGSGKGTGHAAAKDALDLSGARDSISEDESLYVTDVGSGEGILHAYAMWTKKEGVQQIRESVLFVVNEVDQLTAVGSRQGATLLPKLHEAYSGESLAFNYADPTKRLHVRRHHYRMALTLGVQPGRAAALFDAADGGTPQRFLWLPVTDPEMPRHPPPEPSRWTVPMPGRPSTGRKVVGVCTEARDEIIEAHWRRSRGEGDALDGHALYTRLKVAAALAVLDGHLGGDGVTAEDWRLAGVLMAVSDVTRAGVQAELRRAAAGVNEARAQAEGVREVVKADTVEAAAIQKAGRAVMTALGKQPGEWVTGAALRRTMTSRVRPYLDAALDALVLAGTVEVEEIAGQGQSGHRYRSRA